MALADIRKVLGPNVVSSDRDELRIAPEVSCDLPQLLEALACARPGTDSERGLLGQALALFRGSVALEVDSNWIRSQEQTLNSALVLATVRYIDVCSEAGALQSGIEAGNRMLRLMGCHEDIHVALMRLYWASGQPSNLIAQYELLERELEELWGESPGAAARELLERTSARTSKPGTAPSERRILGRDALLTQIGELLQTSGKGVITLHGPGGAGKTTLAIASAEAAGCRYVFVDLGQDHSEADALRRIQTTLGLHVSEVAEAVTRIAAKINTDRIVLILDNFEQLVPGGSAFVQRLSHASDMPLVVTTRVLPDLDGEQAIAVAGLSSEAAMELFDVRARKAAAQFKTTEANIENVRELCSRLDGLPLGIELAAGLSDVFSPAQILVKLDASLHVLKEPSAQGRHSSLEEVIGSSVERLSKEAQRLARVLSLVEGRFSDADVAHLGAGRDCSAALVELVRSALVTVDPGHVGHEYAILDTIRAYLRSLTTDQERDVHLAWACRIGQEPTDQLLLDRREDFVEAIRYGAEKPERHDDVAELVLNLSSLSIEEFAARIEPSVRHLLPLVATGLRPRLAGVWVHVASNVATPDEMLHQLSVAEEFCNGDGDRGEILYRRGTAYKGMGRYEEAIQDFLWVQDHTPPESHVRHAGTLYNLGLCACCVGRNVESLNYHLAALKEVRQTRDKTLLVRVLFDAGSELANQGRGTESLDYFKEAIEHCETLGSIKLEGLTRWQMGDALLSMQRPREAWDELGKSVNLVIKAGFQAGLKWIFLKTAQATWECGHATLACQFLGWLLGEREKANRPLAQYEQVVADALMESLKAELGEYTLGRRLDEGRASSYEELVRELQRVAAPQCDHP